MALPVMPHHSTPLSGTARYVPRLASRKLLLSGRPPVFQVSAIKTNKVTGISFRITFLDERRADDTHTACLNASSRNPRNPFVLTFAGREDVIWRVPLASQQAAVATAGPVFIPGYGERSAEVYWD